MARRFCILLLLLVAASPAALGANVADELRRLLESQTALSTLARGESLYFRKQLDSLYRARKGLPGWVSEHAALARAEDMVEAVQESQRDGLYPADYHARVIGQLLAGLHRRQVAAVPRARRLAALELLLSDAFLLLGEHESGGRLRQAAMRPRVGPDRDITRVLRGLRSVFAGSMPRAELDRLLPRGYDYELMRGALDHYRHLEAAGGFVPIGDGPLLMRGSRGHRVELLIMRLRATEALAPAAGLGGEFDKQVEAAVKQFQARHGLVVDGVVGIKTLKVLETPVSAWINRLEVNLERRRWLPRELAPRRLMVNIADFRATLYDDNQRLLSEPVIVGQSYKQTPELSDRIRYLVINPSWEVPAGIAADEILPSVQRDPAYLQRKGLEVLRGWGTRERVVDPSRVHWRRWTGETLPYHFRQRPGPDNSLGWVKFMFPNALDIYLHDTPAQGLFDHEKRTFSHGCIRVARALKLAAAMLTLEGREDAGSFLLQAVSSGQTRRIDFKEPIPIYITYMSAWTDGTGVLQFRPDVYDRDTDVLNGLYSPLRKNP